MPNLIYQVPTDNLAATGTLTVQSGTEDTAYPKANIYDGNPAKPAKLTTTTGAWRWDFGSAKQLDIVAVIHHNLTAGLNVRIQGNATDAWGAPSLDQAFTIPARQTCSPGTGPVRAASSRRWSLSTQARTIVCWRAG